MKFEKHCLFVRILKSTFAVGGVMLVCSNFALAQNQGGPNDHPVNPSAAEADSAPVHAQNSKSDTTQNPSVQNQAAQNGANKNEATAVNQPANTASPETSPASTPGNQQVVIQNDSPVGRSDQGPNANESARAGGEGSRMAFIFLAFLAIAIGGIGYFMRSKKSRDAKWDESTDSKNK